MRTNTAGFTLIELLIVSALLVIIFISTSAFFMTSLRSGIRTSLWQEIQGEGNYAVSQLGYDFRNARGVVSSPDPTLCNPAPPTFCQTDMDCIAVRNPSGTSSVYFAEWNDIHTGMQLKKATFLSDGTLQATIPLTTISTNVSDLSFDCHETGNQPYIVTTFNMTRQTDSVGSLEQKFRKTVILRNNN